MARPQKKGLEYFPLDCHMNDEANLIVASYGMEGYGVLIQMFQFIYGSNGYYIDWNVKEQRLFSHRVGVKVELVNEIIKECTEWGIFNKEKLEEYSILTSRRIQDHYATATYKRAGVMMEERYLLISISDKKHINNGVTDNGNISTTIVSDDKSTQSKVKKSKVKNNNKDNVQKQVLHDQSEQVWKLYPCKKGKATAVKKIPKLIKEYGIEQLERCINRYIEDVDIRHKNGFEGLNYQNGSTFFNGTYQDYLDKNYQKEQTKPEKQSKFINYDQRTYNFDELEKKAMELLINESGEDE